MKSKRKEKVILVFHSAMRSSWMESLSGIYDYAKTRQWNVQVIEHQPSVKNIKLLLDFWHPDGVIVECSMCKRDDALLANVFGETPVSYLFCNTDKVRRNSIRIVRDNESLGRLAAREFLSLGLKSFAYFGFSGLLWSESRQRAFAVALKQNGHDVTCMSREFFEDGRNAAESGFRERFVKWLKALPKPCGLLTANDLLAVEVLNVCRVQGIKVPNEISVLGVDNDEIACENATPTLSSIRMNFDEGGYQAALLLDERLSEQGGKGRDCCAIPVAGLTRRQSTRLLPRANSDVSRALEIIRIKACEGLRPKDVIAELGCSRRILEMRFKESTGHSIGDEICTVRMQYVKELLLRSNVQIESIAARCGWKSPARLRVAFHALEGLSMRRWRELHAIWHSRNKR